jgi:glutamate---cysteine ligase / carboxylate-amine ligase
MVEPGLTVGVEEEFLLVDEGTHETVPRAAAVLAHAPMRQLPIGATLQRELQSCQVELATGVCTNLAVLRQQLLAGRQLLAVAAKREDARLISSGTPVLAADHPPATVGTRFEAISDIYQGQATKYQSCGCHVHVGVPDREIAVAVINHLRPWLPTLLSLSVNSPFDNGTDTGFGSWRTMEQAGFPGSGVPPWFPSASAYDDQVDRLVTAGVLVDSAMTFWLARPSPRFPTVEVRVADAACTADEAVLQAALTRALVRTALADIADGHAAPAIGDQVLGAALWSAARYGLRGPGVEPESGNQVPAEDLVTRLFERVSPALEETGDLERAQEVVKSLLAGGTGAERQRQAASAGPAAVVDMLSQVVGQS